MKEELSLITGNYMIWMIPFMYLFFVVDTYEIFIMAQEEFNVPMIVHNLSYSANPLWCYIFTQQFKFGLAGIALSFTLCAATSLVMMLIYFR